GNGVELPGFDSAWCELKKKLVIPIEEPYGSALERVKSRIPAVIVPPKLEGTLLVPLARAMIALAEEAARRGENSFHAPYRLIASLAGVDKMTALRRLGALSEAGFLSLIEAGLPGTGPHRRKANTWSWHDPPCRGATCWNSTTKTKKRPDGEPATSAA